MHPLSSFYMHVLALQSYLPVLVKIVKLSSYAAYAYILYYVYVLSRIIHFRAF